MNSALNFGVIVEQFLLGCQFSHTKNAVRFVDYL
jgi:hypothetical protein